MHPPVPSARGGEPRRGTHPTAALACQRPGGTPSCSFDLALAPCRCPPAWWPPSTSCTATTRPPSWRAPPRALTRALWRVSWPRCATVNGPWLPGPRLAFTDPRRMHGCMHSGLWCTQPKAGKQRVTGAPAAAAASLPASPGAPAGVRARAAGAEPGHLVHLPLLPQAHPGALRLLCLWPALHPVCDEWVPPAPCLPSACAAPPPNPPLPQRPDRLPGLPGLRSVHPSRTCPSPPHPTPTRSGLIDFQSSVLGSFIL